MPAPSATSQTAPDDAIVQPTMRIGALAKRTGKTTRAIRHYESLGLLDAAARTSGGFREYGPEALERVAWITALQELGFTLPHIQALHDLARERTLPREVMAEARAQFAEKRATLDAQIARLSKLRGELDGALSFLDACGTCDVTGEPVESCTSCSSHAEPAPPLVRALTHSSAAKKGRALPVLQDVRADAASSRTGAAPGLALDQAG